MECNHANFNLMIRAFANPDAYTNNNWPLFFDQTNVNWNLNQMWYSDYASWGGARTTYEYPFSQMSPPTNDGYSSLVRVFQPGMRMENGYSQVISVSSTQIRVRVLMNSRNYDFQYTYRMGFRFYTSRLQVSGNTCSSVSIWSSRYTTNGWCRQGSCSYSCGTGDRMFYVAFYLYRNAESQSQWPTWIAGDYYDITFNFNAVAGDVSNYPNEVYAQATLVWENTIYHINNQGKCDCCQ